MKKIRIFLLVAGFLALSNTASAFNSSLYAERPNIYAMFKTCANYITLIKNKKCPKPSIKRSSKSTIIGSKGPLLIIAATKFGQHVTAHNFELYTDNKEKLLGVDNMCQIGLYACGNIIDTGFGGGNKACSSVCNASNCKDPYIYYACKAASDSSDVLDGRKVCSNKSTEQCLNANKDMKFDGISYEKAFDKYGLSTLEKLDKAQTEKDKKLLYWLINILHRQVKFIHEDNGRKAPTSIEFSKNEFSFFHFPETVQEKKLNTEKALKISFGKALKETKGILEKEFAPDGGWKATKSENTKFGKRHEKLWYDKSISPDVRKKVDELLRGLEPSQADTIKRIVTEMTTTGITAEKRLELLKAVVRLSKNNFGKKAKTYSNAVFLNGEKFDLWLQIARKIPFMYNLEKRLQVIKSIDRLSDYQLRQVTRYNLFREVYPDDLPATRDILEQIDNVKKLDERTDSFIPDYLKGFEIPDGTAPYLLTSKPYSEAIEKIIIEFYKDTHTPDFVSPKGTSIYRLYNPNKKFQALIKAIRFLDRKTVDFHDSLRDNWKEGSKIPPKKGIEVINKLKNMPVTQLTKLVSPEFFEILKKEIPVAKPTWPGNIGLDWATKFESYEDVLKKLEE